jgi:hypothetical protein
MLSQLRIAIAGPLLARKRLETRICAPKPAPQRSNCPQTVSRNKRGVKGGYGSA